MADWIQKSVHIVFVLPAVVYFGLYFCTNRIVPKLNFHNITLLSKMRHTPIDGMCAANPSIISVDVLLALNHILDVFHTLFNLRFQRRSNFVGKIIFGFGIRNGIINLGLHT